MSASRQNILIGVFLVMVLVGAYLWFGDSLPFAPVAGESQIVVEYAGAIAEVSRLKAITLDTEVVKGNAFGRLVVPILPPYPDVKPGGRNPYLPL